MWRRPLLRSMGAAAAKKGGRPNSEWRDPHSISDKLDEKTSKAIINRLESRGKDPIFRSLFESYHPTVIERCSQVLEIGGGTGVVARALVANGFSRKLLCVDQNKSFLEAGEKFAAAERVPKEVLSFAVADARTLRNDVGRRDFDGVIMHTLISHVDDPLLILMAAREVAKPGALLAIVDGDYPGLVFHSHSKPQLSETMSKALVTATFCSPSVVRDLPSLFAKSGWALESASGKTVSEIGKDFSYWKTFAEAYMPRVVGSGMVPQAQVDEWWAEQRELAKQGQFFASCTYYTLLARAV